MTVIVLTVGIVQCMDFSKTIPRLGDWQSQGKDRIRTTNMVIISTI